jgi:thiaminase/transcriptional activator TenA
MSGSFSETLRSEAAPVWEAIFAHPFLAELAAGTLPEESFRFYIVQDYRYLEAFGRAVALALGRAPDSAAVRLLAARVMTPIERPLHARLFELTGLTIEQAEAEPVAPTNRAYIDHLLATASLRGLGETAAALLPCPWTYDEIGARLAAAGEIPNLVYHEWAGFYTAGFLCESVRAWRELVDRAAAEAGPAQRTAMREAFLLSSHYELRFWAMAYQRETWVPGPGARATPA